MLPQVILLLGAAVAAWLFLNWLSRAKPSLAARVLKRGGFAVLLVFGLWLVLTGKLAGLVAVAAGAAPWAMRAARLHGLWTALRRFGIRAKGGQASGGGTSRVDTRFVRMELDHDSGRLEGEVIEGSLRGRRLSTLSQGEAELLWREAACDPDSARVLEAWLDRAWPDWRTASEPPPREPVASGMTVDEAREILGIDPTAGPDDIRAAHRRLMLANHPDHGGSTWIAARINQARDLLLGD
jgi:hypothetical protein